MSLIQSVCSLGECIDLYGGGTPSKDKPEYWNGDIPWASVKDLKTNRIECTQDSITALGLTNSSSKMVKAGSIVIATRMAVGRVAISEIDVAINQDLKAIVCSENVDVNYLFYFLASQEARFSRLASGATVKGIKINHILDMKIPLPPLAEQQKIAAILDAADSLRKKDQQLIDHYTTLSQSLFLEMFGDPVSNPMGWEVKALDDLADKIMSGSTPKGGRNVYVEKGIIFFRSQNVWRNEIKLEDVAYLDEKTHASMKKSSLKNKDILMTKTGRFNTENSSLGRAAMYLGEDDKANVNGHVYLIRLKDFVISEFVLFILTTEQYRDYIRRVCVGGIDKRQINKKHLEDFPIINPPINLQQQYTDRLAVIERLKQQAQASLEKSNDLFNSLLQKAFNGELTGSKAA